MGRPKLIEDKIVLNLIKRYFYEECQNDIKKMTAANITKFINKNGYPDYPSSTLRRTPIAMNYIAELKKCVNNENYVTIASYQTVDAVALIESNRSKENLIRAINERDCYYKKVADSAVYYLEKYNKLLDKYEEEKKEKIALIEKVKELEELISNYKYEAKFNKNELESYKAIVDDYVYPEIANELLVREGFSRKTKNILKENTVPGYIITSTTNVKKTAKSNSDIILGLYSTLDEE